MQQEIITLETGKILDYLYHIDLKAYGIPRMISVYVAVFDDAALLMDCGSSLETKKLLRFIKKLGINLSSFKYLITTHHHFDHNGGLWYLYEILKKYNPQVKILTNQKTKELLNNYESHLSRAKRTYGNLTGSMKPIEDSAFILKEASLNFNQNPSKLDFIGSFSINGAEVKLGLLKTPGHTPDHQCPLFFKNGEIEFIQFGESVGTIYHSSELVTMPTSMPTYYNHQEYMATLKNLKNLSPLKAGFNHFGVINGKENIKQLLLEHESFMNLFREKINTYYKEKPETRYVLEKITPLLLPRTDLSIEENPVFSGIALGIVYGMLMDLGYRKE